MGDAEIFAEDLGVILFCKSGIPFLDFAQKAFFRGEERAASVDVDASAFKYNTAAFVLRLPDAAFQFVIHFGDDRGVLFVIRILGPAVELKVIEGSLAGFVAHTDGTRVATNPARLPSITFS